LEELFEEAFHTGEYAINKRLTELLAFQDTTDFRDITYCTQDIFQLLNFDSAFSLQLSQCHEISIHSLEISGLHIGVL
jgi:hypothetical protein